MEIKQLLLICLLMVIYASQCFTQEQQISTPSQLWTEPDTQDFKEIQRRVEEYYSNRDKGKGSGYKQWKRWEYMNEQRLTPDGKITNYAARNWEAWQKYQKERLGDNSDASVASWTFLGPTDWINGQQGWSGGLGRINCITFHPTDANIIYVGAPSGGVWKTTDGGNSWTPIADDLPVIGVSGIVVDYIDPSILYILTGDGDFSDTKSIGVLKSTNGGATWENTGLSYIIKYDDEVGYKLAQHPTNNQILFSVQTDGLWKTTNGGTTWETKLAGSFRDMEFKPGSPDIVYISSSNEFYRSTDVGENWTLITSGLTTGEERIAIGVSPADPEYVYLLCGPNTGAGSFKGLFRSTDSGLNFSTMATTPNILGYEPDGSDAGDQSFYDLAIAISLTNEAHLITGGINNWRSTDYGSTFDLSSYGVFTGNETNHVHIDIHALEINPLDNVIYCGSDGGIFRSTDFGDTWEDLSAGLGISQFYKIAGVDSNPDLIIGGTQDNGVNKYDGSMVMTHLFVGDGTDCMIDPDNNDILYFSLQNGNLFKSLDGGNTVFNIKPDGVTGRWVTPFVMDPHLNIYIYGAYHQGVYRSTNSGTDWAQFGVGPQYGTALANCEYDRRLYVSGNSGGYKLWTRSAYGGTWSDITNYPNSYLMVNSIAVKPNNSSIVYITFPYFMEGHKVFKSYDAGLTWENISGTLPNVIVNCIAYEGWGGSNDVQYIGTDVGVFYRNASSGGDWVPFNQNLPNVIVTDLEINKTHNLITAGTYGRGIWRSESATELFLNVMFFLEGCFDSGVMNTSLKTLDLIPLTQPYNAPPWNYTGSETVTSIPDDVVDWVLIELRSDETTILERKAAFLKNDGSLINPLDGSSYLRFQAVAPDYYYIVIRHRNHLPIMTADKVYVGATPVLRDLRTDLSKVYGTNAMKDLGGGYYGMYSADGNKDGGIYGEDYILYQTSLGNEDYLFQDYNLDGVVDDDDYMLYQLNQGFETTIP